MTSAYNYPEHHGIALVGNSFIENFGFEPLATDPLAPKAGTAWFNTTDRVIRYTVVDEGGAVVTRTIGDNTAITNIINQLRSDLDAETARATAAEGTVRTDMLAAIDTLRTTLEAADAAATAALTAETTRATAAEGALRTDLDTLRTDLTTAGQTAADAVALVQAELDASQAAIGLNTDGTFAAPAGTNYLGDATSVVTSLTALDTAIRDAANAASGDANTKVDKAGSTMTGDLVMAPGAGVIINDQPTNPLHAVNLAFVEARLNGLAWKDNVVAATTGPIDLANPGVLDGVTLNEGDRALVKNQPDAISNGIYVLTGGALVRAADANDAEEIRGATVLVSGGDTQANTNWTAPMDRAAVVGTDGITWVQTNGANSIVAGTGLSKDGNTINVNLGAGLTQLPNDEVGIDVRPAFGLFLTEDGTTESTATGAALGIRVDGNTLELGANGVRVAAGVMADIGSRASQAELDATQAGAGLNTDGTYAAQAGANYIAGATSLANADQLLDTALRTVTDRVDALTGSGGGSISDLQAAIDAERDRATGVEGGLRTDLTAEAARAAGIEGALRTDVDAATAAIAAETTRATGVEDTLRTDLDTAAGRVTAEIARATGVEDELRGLIVSNNSGATDAIAAEVTRATAAEQALRTDLTAATDALTAETTRATGIETGLRTDVDALRTDLTAAGTAATAAVTTERDRAVAAEGDLQAAITAETTRATGVEGGLRTDLDAATAAVAAETTRATGVEDELRGLITQGGTDNTAAVTTERDRATAAEAALRTDLDAATAAITAEATRATGIEGTLRTDLDAASAAVAAETTRATGIEGGLRTDVDALRTDLTAETTRATGVEDELRGLITQNNTGATGAVTTERDRAVAAETAIVDAVNNSVFRYLSPTAQATHIIAHNLNDNFAEYHIMVEGTDGVFRNDYVSMEETDANTITVYLSVARRVKFIARSGKAIAAA